jgi:UDP-glucose 4-epimerase
MVLALLDTGERVVVLDNLFHRLQMGGSAARLIVGDEGLLAAAVKAGVARFIFSSTATVYGNAPRSRRPCVPMKVMSTTLPWRTRAVLAPG